MNKEATTGQSKPVVFLDSVEASRWFRERGIRVSPATLRTWRWKGGGPQFLKLNGARSTAYYRVEDLETWIERRQFSNTGEARGGGGA